MKKSKSKALAKKAKKSAFKDIKAKLANELSEVAGKLGKDSKKIRRIIERESKKLVKKISKKLKIQTRYLTSDSPKTTVIKPDAIRTEETRPALSSTVSKAPPRVRTQREKVSVTGIKTKTAQKASAPRQRKIKDPVA